MDEKIRKLEERKKQLLNSIEFVKQKKKEIIELVQNLVSKYNSGRISRYEYDEKLSVALKGRSVEQWIKYYDDYFSYYEYQINLSDKLIKQEKRKPKEKLSEKVLGGKVYGGWEDKKKKNFTPLLSALILIVVVGIFISLSFILIPVITKDAGVLGPESVEVSEFVEGELLSDEDLEILKGQFFEQKPFVVTEDVSYDDADVIEKINQYQAVINQSVKWKKQIQINPGVDFKINLPENSKNIRVVRISDGQEYDLSEIVSAKEKKKYWLLGEKRVEVEINQGLISANAIVSDEESGDELYEVIYETPAPVIREEVGVDYKKVIITGPDDVHYKNVFSYTKISEKLKLGEESKIKIYQTKLDGRNLRKEIKFKAYDTNENGFIDSLEWITPMLSEAEFEIIIEITKAEHLDENKNFISDIYEEVKDLDNNYSEVINNNEYVKIRFESVLNNKNDITIYPRVISGNPFIEVYEVGGEGVVAEFDDIIDGENKVFLTGLGGVQDRFYLKVVDGSIEIDYIVDPNYPPDIEFLVPPTPDNNEQAYGNSFQVNLSTQDESDHYSFVDFENDLLFWMRMDEVNSSGDPYDNSSYGKNGTAMGDANQSSVNGKFGESFMFDGDGDYIDFAHYPELGGGGTISFWGKLDAINVNNRAEPHFIYVTEEFRIYYDDDGSTNKQNDVFDFEIYADFEWQNFEAVDVRPEADRWYHFVIVDDNVNSYFYIDGIYQGSVPYSIELPYTSVYPKIGAAGDETAEDFLDGNVDDVLFFDRVLTELEIRALNNSESHQYGREFLELDVGDHFFQGYAVDELDKINKTDLWNVSLILGFPEINFANPTLNNSDVIDYNSLFINVSSSDGVKNISTFIDFDNTLELWFSMDDVSGSNIYDNSNNGNNGTVTGTTQDTGYLGNSISFGDGSDKIELDENITFSDEFTFSFWGFRGEYGNDGIFADKESNTEMELDFLLSGQGNTIYMTNISNSQIGQIHIDTSPAIPLNEWFHIVITRNNSGSLRIYLNGLDTTSGTPYNPGSFQIGRIGHGADNSPSFLGFNGKLDDILIFKRELNISEVKALYANETEKYLERNFTGLQAGDYDFIAYTQNTAGQINQTETRSVEILPELGLLNVSLEVPIDDFQVNQGDIFDINASVSCEGEIGSSCGIVYALAKYNNSLATPDTKISLINDVPFYVKDNNTYVSPSQVGYLTSSSLNGANSVFVENNYAYVASSTDSSLTIINVGDSASLVQAGKYKNTTSLSGADHIFVLGNYAYLASTFGSSVTIIDITNKQSPFQVSSYKNLSSIDWPRAVFVEGNYAYVPSSDDDALVILDVSNKQNPFQIGFFSNSTSMDFPREIKVLGDYAYVASSISNSITIIDITNKQLPYQIGYINSGTYLKGVSALDVVGDYIFTANYDTYRTVSVINATNKQSLNFVDSFTNSSSLGFVNSIRVDGDYAYVGAINAYALTIINISDLNSIYQIGFFRNTTSLNIPESVFVLGDYAYVASSGSDSLTVIGSGKSNPQKSSLIMSQGDIWNVNWRINATGEGFYEIGVLFNSSYSPALLENHTINNTVEIIPALGATITDCQLLDEFGESYSLTQNITKNDLEDNCINITAENIVLDCQGNYISSDDDFAGVYSNQFNTTIKNCNISMGGSGGTGIKLYSANYSQILGNVLHDQWEGLDLDEIYNVFIINNNLSDNFYGMNANLLKNSELRDNFINASTSVGAFFQASSNNFLKNNSITNCLGGATAACFYLTNSYENRMAGGIMNSTADGEGIYFSNSSNNKFNDFIIDEGTGNVLEMISGGGSSINNSFINVSYDITKEDVVSGSELKRKWYYRAWIKDDLGNGVEDADVVLYNSSSDLQFNLTTTFSGLTPWTEVIEYTNDGARSYFSNYTIDSTNKTLQESHTLNMTYELNFNGTIFDNILFTLPGSDSPQITYVQYETDAGNNVNLVPGGERNLSVNFTAYDPQGFGDLNDLTTVVNFSHSGYNVVRDNLSCDRILEFDTDYANYTCEVGMWYFDQAGNWDIYVSINDTSDNQGVNTSEYFYYVQWVWFEIDLGVLNWSDVEIGVAKASDNNITLRNLGNKDINDITVNATDLPGKSNPNYNIFADNFDMRETEDLHTPCVAGTSLQNSTYVSSGVSLSYSNSNKTDPASSGLGFCLNQVEVIPPQVYETSDNSKWDINAVSINYILLLIKLFNLEIVLFAVGVSIKKNKKYKLSEKDLAKLEKKLKKRYDISIRDLLEDKSGIKIPIDIFKNKLGPAEILVKYLKENIKLKVNDIARLLNRSESSIWTSYNNASKKMSKEIKVDKKRFVCLEIFANRNLSVLEAVVDYYKKQGFRNIKIAEILNKDQRNISVLYSRIKKKSKKD
jgi:hypothetical protein